MNMEQYASDNYIKPENVEKSEKKIITLLDPGIEVNGKFGNQTKFKCQLSGEDNVYAFIPSKKSVRIMIEQEGEESKNWIGKFFRVAVEKNTNDNDVVVVLEKEKEENPVGYK